MLERCKSVTLLLQPVAGLGGRPLPARHNQPHTLHSSPPKPLVHPKANMCTPKHVLLPGPASQRMLTTKASQAPKRFQTCCTPKKIMFTHLHILLPGPACQLSLCLELSKLGSIVGVCSKGRGTGEPQPTKQRWQSRRGGLSPLRNITGPASSPHAHSPSPQAHTASSPTLGPPLRHPPPCSSHSPAMHPGLSPSPMLKTEGILYSGAGNTPLPCPSAPLRQLIPKNLRPPTHLQCTPASARPQCSG
jgi:hypothetical protein